MLYASVSINSWGCLIEYARRNSGKIKLLGVVKNQRVALLPDIPSFGEAMPEFQQPRNWTGIFGMAGLPPQVLARCISRPAKLPISKVWHFGGISECGKVAECAELEIRYTAMVVDWKHTLSTM